MRSTVDSKSSIPFEKLKEILSSQKSLPIRVVTGSMEPLIKTGEELTIEEISEPLKIFDIVVFWNGAAYVCHFVWRLNRKPNSKGERWITTRSLVSEREDFPVLETHILGRVVDRQIPFSKKLLMAIRAWLRS